MSELEGLTVATTSRVGAQLGNAQRRISVTPSGETPIVFGIRSFERPPYGCGHLHRS